MRSGRRFEILHYGHFGTLGGIEQILAALVRDPATAEDVRHHLLVRSDRVHPHVADIFAQGAASVDFVKQRGGRKLPRWPEALRRGNASRLARAKRADVAVLWNTLTDRYAPHVDFGGARVVYYEQSAAWYPPGHRDAAAVLARADAAVCCSHAARRMLELRWDYRGPVAVCLNGLRPDVPVGDGSPKRRGSGPFRLGAAARMVPLKGLSLAIHALAALRRRGADCVLDLAGAGPEEERLRRESERLGVADAVRFRGLMADMAAFYAEIDCFLCPSLNEPFGLVAIEAAAQGCVVVASRVDGLPEVVVHGETGLCLEPGLAATDYVDLGGTSEGLPPLVYDPRTDGLAPPKLLDPESIADAVASLLDDEERFARLSAAGQERARDGFSSGAFCERVVRTLRSLSEHPEREAAEA